MRRCPPGLDGKLSADDVAASRFEWRGLYSRVHSATDCRLTFPRRHGTDKKLTPTITDRVGEIDAGATDP